MTTNDSDPQGPVIIDQDLDLRQYARLIWRHRLVIGIVAIAFAAGAFGLGVTSKPTYIAQVTLAVNSRSPGLDGGERPSLASLRPYVQNDASAAKVISELGLDKPPYGEHVSGFFGSVVTIEEVKNSTVWLLTATLQDPDQAARLANTVAAMMVDISQRVSRDQVVQVRDEKKAQRDEAQKGLDEAEDQLRTFREASQIELLRKDVDAALDQRGQLLSLLIQIETEKARLAKAEQELGARKPVETLRRTIDSDPALMEGARSPSMVPGALLGLETRNEIINPVYQQLDLQIAKSQTNLAALEKQKAEIIDARKLDGAHLAMLNRLYQAEGQLQDLQMRDDLARDLYKQVAAAYEAARVAAAGLPDPLQIAAPAVAPDRPLARHLARKTLTAAMIGLILSVLGVLLYGLLFAKPLES